jgi:hypothetical protein
MIELPEIHLEFSLDKKEVEVYVGGYFLTSTDKKSMSPEVREQVNRLLKSNNKPTLERPNG